MDIHDKIKEMWKQAVAEGKNPPPLSELLERFPKERVPLTESEREYAEKIAARLRNKAG